MRREILIFVINFLLVKSNENCSTWPTKLKTIEQCCNIPNILDVYPIINSSSHCNDSACNAKFYLDSTKIIENGKLNKTLVYLIAMYENGPGSYWDEIVLKSLDKCEGSVNSKKDPESQLIELLSCFKREASKNCPEYDYSIDCRKVEKFYTDCHQEEYDCKKWPAQFTNETMIACCNSPTLASNVDEEDCNTNCTFSKNRIKCSINCIINVRKLIKDGQIDELAVKTALNENKNQLVPWKMAIDDAVEICLKEMSKTEYSDPTDMIMYFAVSLHKELATNCMDYDEFGMVAGCYSYIKFRKDCPNLKPF